MQFTRQIYFVVMHHFQSRSMRYLIPWKSISQHFHFPCPFAAKGRKSKSKKMSMRKKFAFRFSISLNQEIKASSFCSGARFGTGWLYQSSNIKASSDTYIVLPFIKIVYNWKNNGCPSTPMFKVWYSHPTNSTLEMSKNCIENFLLFVGGCSPG